MLYTEDRSTSIFEKLGGVYLKKARIDGWYTLIELASLVSM